MDQFIHQSPVIRSLNKDDLIHSSSVEELNTWDQFIHQSPVIRSLNEQR
jgi:hypothetical protein